MANVNVIKWVVIVAKIVLLIAGGLTASEAVSEASEMFGVSEGDIWAHGGF